MKRISQALYAALLFGLSQCALDAGVGYPTFLSPQVSPIALADGFVFVANTPAGTVDVIQASTRKTVTRIHVGIEPVSLAARPDGREVWVANHVSDSVSVIDTDPSSPTHLQVIATVQDLDPATKATRFDEPVGIAFANNAKAYVALSSENQIAVIDVARRTVIQRLDLPAQDPRALLVRAGRLYVIPFESGNQTQLSGGTGKPDGNLVTFNAWNHSIATNNVLSLGHVVDIVKNPKVPDRDLFVFDTTTDQLLETVSTLGTLLYGLAVDSNGVAYIAQTDARNDVNGRAGTRKQGLAELENRAFLNRITRVPSKAGRTNPPSFIDLEPLPPQHPEEGMALATPYAIQISDDNSTLVVSAAGSDKLFSVDAATGKILGRVTVGAVPQGIALECSADGSPSRAWVLNAAADTVSLVDLSRSSKPEVIDTIVLADPTHVEVLGTQFLIETDTSATRLDVSQGTVRVKRLSDGTELDVPTRHRVLAAADHEFTVAPALAPVDHWTSRLLLGPERTLGKWLPPAAGRDAALLAVPFTTQLGWTIFAAATRVSKWDAPPVTLHPDSRLRVRGRLGVSRTVYFGVHLRDASGAFAGRFLRARSPHEFGAGEVFDVTLPIRDFILDPALKHMSKKLPARPFELTVESVFCHTLTHPAGLELFQVEVIPTAVP